MISVTQMMLDNTSWEWAIKKHFRVNIRRHCEEKSESETASQRQMEQRAACTRMMTGNDTRSAMARNTTHPQSHVEAVSVRGFQWHKKQH